MRSRFLASATLASVVVITTPAAATSIPVTTDLDAGQPGVAMTTVFDLLTRSGSLWPIGIVVNADVEVDSTGTKRSRGSVPGGASGVGGLGGAEFAGSAAPISNNGAVSGWRGLLGSSAEVLSTSTPNDADTGIATGTTGGHTHSDPVNVDTGSIDIPGSSSGWPDLPGLPTDSALESLYVPLIVQDLGGSSGALVQTSGGAAGSTFALRGLTPMLFDTGEESSDPSGLYFTATDFPEGPFDEIGDTGDTSEAEVTATPEPATMTLVGGGLLVAAFRRRSNRR